MHLFLSAQGELVLICSREYATSINYPSLYTLVAVIFSSLVIFSFLPFLGAGSHSYKKQIINSNIVFYLPRILVEHLRIYSCPPWENWFKYVRREYAASINYPSLCTLVAVISSSSVIVSFLPFLGAGSHSFKKQIINSNIVYYLPRILREYATAINFPSLDTWVAVIFLFGFFFFGAGSYTINKLLIGIFYVILYKYTCDLSTMTN